MKPLLRILHLEDHPYDVILVHAALEADGIECEIVVVRTREALLAALGGSRVDLILSDFRLPGFDGLVALALAREHFPQVPFVLVSGSLPAEVEARFSGRGTAYVPKNDLTQLGAVVLTVLAEGGRSGTAA